jgi:alkylhydroperoxidase family enzyme
MTEEMITQMLDHRNSDFDERLMLALDLTEDFVMNHANSVNDEFMARLKEHYSEAEIVELTIAIGVWDSVHKFNNVFDVHPPVEEGLFTVDPPDVPEAMRQHVMDPGNKY